ncbi:PRD domain-containing protein [Martelella alba]|uniref:PRD domain-containing protein n=2 Tax=Martelella alba TaxID=2590451 RepID=A0ABY2SNI5_9HYPH|nr:PRD domain-containing protein [Martelella alba]
MTARLADQTLSGIMDMLKTRNIRLNEVQEQMLTSHVKAMVRRSLTGEPLPEVDVSLFEEISPDSMDMAREIVARLANLPVEEAYLLSVHFEVAKSNDAT